LWKLGYAAQDLIQNIFRVCKTMDTMSEFLMLEFLKVTYSVLSMFFKINSMSDQEIGMTHMKIIEGLGTLLQLTGLLARLCEIGAQNES